MFEKLLRLVGWRDLMYTGNRKEFIIKQQGEIKHTRWMEEWIDMDTGERIWKDERSFDM